MPRARRHEVARPHPLDLPAAEPIGLLAAELLAWAGRQPTRPILLIAESGRRAEALSHLLSILAPTLKVAVFPPWDTLPYDHMPPSRVAMGRRAGVLRWLIDRASPPDIVITTPMAALQRVPEQSV